MTDQNATDVDTTDLPHDTAPVADGAAVADAEPDNEQERADGGGQEPSSGGREAAKYRVRLREAEQQRDALAARLSDLQRGQVEQLAGTHLADGADLWRDGMTLDALLDDNGGIDSARVAEAARAVAAAHPHWGVPARQRPQLGGLRSGATGADGYTSSASWADLLNTRTGN